jgi:ElaB/YqjD/DUF883 family membrane-anchored ribosome-binding protein
MSDKQDNIEAAKNKAAAAGEVVKEKVQKVGDEINEKEKEKNEPSLQEKAGKALNDAKSKVQETFDAVTGKAKAAGEVAKDKTDEIGDEIKEKESRPSK